MQETFSLAAVGKLARVTSEALDVAILECRTGQAEQCRQTLAALHELWVEIAEAVATNRVAT